METVNAIYKNLCAHMPDHDARYVLQKRAGLEWAEVITQGDVTLDIAISSQITADLNAYRHGKPLSRIYNEREFWGLPFTLAPDTLDPRPDSETIIDVALKYYRDTSPPKTILDLGTGSGCLLLAMLHEFKSAQGIGVDYAFNAAQAARNNADSLDLSPRADFICGEWAHCLNQKFDLVITNPPYIRSKVILDLDKNVQKYDPILALDGGDDGMQAYHQIFSHLSSILKPEGMALMEIGFDQSDDLMRLSKEYGFISKNVHHDLGGNPRVVDIFWP